MLKILNQLSIIYHHTMKLKKLLRIIISDAQTSGGLLLCSPKHLVKIVSEKIFMHGGSVNIIGKITEKSSNQISILKSND